MRNLRCCFIVAVAVSVLAISLSGCSIGIKRQAHDAPSEDDVYYEGAVDSYGDSVPRSSGFRHHGPDYDPWTMGTYYQNYGGPPPANPDSDSSGANNVRSESRRPTVRDKNPASVSQPQASTSSDSSNSKRNRASLRDRRRRRPGVNREDSSTSRRSGSTNSVRAKQEKTHTQQDSQKAQPKETKSTTEEEDEKNKKKKKVSP